MYPSYNNIIILLFLYITEVQESVLRDPGFINEILLYY